MQAVLLDTNVIILHLAGKINLSFSEIQPHISSLTVFELLQYPGLSSNEEADINAIIESCVIVPVDGSIASRAAKLARSHKIGTIDLLIAATSLELEAPLITRNQKHFQKIRGIIVHTDLN